jgi:hypothetical protein
MKKIVILFFIVVSTAASAQSPNFNEWFRQKKTQRKYLIQQIAALKVYLDFLKKGYTIVQKGTNLISTIKQGSFNLHNNYFSSLKNVSRVVRDSPKLSAVMHYQQSILVGFRKLYDESRHDENFSPGEIDYIQHVYQNMLTECNVSIDELVILATTGEASMKDDERLLRLDKVHEDLQEKFAFAQRFINTTKALSHERSREMIQMDEIKKMIDEI